MRTKIKKNIATILKKTGLYQTTQKTYVFLILLSQNIKNFFSVLFRNVAVVVLYHRISDEPNDPHRIAVSPRFFNEHLGIFKKYFTIVSLDTVVSRVRTRSLQGNELAITFDDGYADNVHIALPILEQNAAHGTVFIATGFVGKSSYPWDDSSSNGRPMFANEILRLDTSDFVSIGAHTDSHRQLSSISGTEQGVEISHSKEILERILKHTVNALAYPFGTRKDFNKESMNGARQAGFAYACANTQGVFAYTSNLFAIPRIIIPNLSAQQLWWHLWGIFLARAIQRYFSFFIKYVFLWSWKLRGFIIKPGTLKFVPPCYFVYVQKIRPFPRVVVDVGVGDNPEFALFFIHASSHTRSFGVDPTHAHTAILRRIESKHAGRFVFLPYALTARKEIVRFYEHEGAVSGSVFLDHFNMRGNVRYYDVSGITLEDIFNVTGEKEIDIIKIDIEGCEYDVIRSLDKILAQRIHQLIIEFHYWSIERFSIWDTMKSIAYIRKLGYRVYSKDGVNFLFYKA